MIRDLDITRDVCPLTFVKVSQAMAKLDPDTRLRVVLRPTALLGVMSTIKSNGHRVVRSERQGDQVVLEVERAGNGPGQGAASSGDAEAR